MYMIGYELASINQVSGPQLCLEYQWHTNVTDRAALPQIRVETLIGYQAEFEITN